MVRLIHWMVYLLFGILFEIVEEEGVDWVDPLDEKLQSGYSYHNTKHSINEK